MIRVHSIIIVRVRVGVVKSSVLVTEWVVLFEYVLTGLAIIMSKVRMGSFGEVNSS